MMHAAMDNPCAMKLVSTRRKNALRCVPFEHPAAAAAKCRLPPAKAGNAFFNGFSKMIGRKHEEAKEKSVDQRSTVDKMLTGDGSRPVFPPYTVIKKSPGYTLRLYEVFPVVEMAYQRREEGYASLGAYIDGNNAQSMRFAYSQPVVMCYEPDGRKTMQMFLALRRSEGEQAGHSRPVASLASLPAPLESGLAINVAGGEVVAVMQFDGYITPASAEAVRRRLTAALQQDGIRLAPEDASGRFRCAQYGAVYQLGDRLNEMMLRVEI